MEKLIGDAVMAVFGLPVVHEDGAVHATRAACEVEEALPALDAAVEAEWACRSSSRAKRSRCRPIACSAWPLEARPPRRRQNALMVGREEEVADLQEMLARAKSERAGRMATVVADAGKGKSRLIDERHPGERRLDSSRRTALC